MTAKHKQSCKNGAAGSLASAPVLALCKKGCARKGAVKRALRHGRSGAMLISAGAGWWAASTGTKEKDVVEFTAILGATGAVAGFAGGVVASLVFDAVR